MEISRHLRLAPAFLRMPAATRGPYLLLAAGLAALYVPTLASLLNGIWGTEQYAHGPLVLALALWLLWRRRSEILQASRRPGVLENLLGWGLTVVALLAYYVGRSQRIEYVELASLPLVLAGLALVLGGSSSLRRLTFPLVFMLFMLPLPGLIVAALTMPMKIGVSAAAESALQFLGLPVARTGVILQVGRYQLLVADACAGLQTMLTMEAMGLLYLNLVERSSPLRNLVMGIMIIPISFAANIVRVVALCLITYLWGDAAGQGFLHGFAGLLLFSTGLALVIGMDKLVVAAGAYRAGARPAC